MTMLLILLSTVAIASASVLKAQLEDPAWQNVLSKGGEHISSGRTKRLVQLDSSQAEPQEPCQLSNGDPGVCRRLEQCMQDDFKFDFSKFADYLCILDKSDPRKIGTCCPVKSQDSGLAGDLPATAPKEDNEANLKIKRAENRGCGISTRPHTEVPDSNAANPREWPWMASVIPSGLAQYCGGALITDQHVLTAAHCLRSYEAKDLTVRLGEYDFTRDDDSRCYDFQVIEKRPHVDFQTTTYKNDIAILKLNRPAVFNTYVWPICLPPPGLDIVNETTVLVGWGTQWYGGPNSRVLMEVSMPVWDLKQCRAGFTESIFDENLCAGGYDGGQDSCQKDSGGPLMYQTSSGRWAVVGIVTWGVRCGEPNHPGVYTRVDAYRQWIMDNTRD